MNTKIIFYIRTVSKKTKVFSIVTSKIIEDNRDAEKHLENLGVFKDYLHLNDLPNDNYGIIDLIGTKEPETEYSKNPYDYEIEYKKDINFIKKYGNNTEYLIAKLNETIKNHEEKIKNLEENLIFYENLLIDNNILPTKELINKAELRFKKENNLNEDEYQHWLKLSTKNSYFKISTQQAKESWARLNDIKLKVKEPEKIEITEEYIDVLGYKAPYEFFRDYIHHLSRRLSYSDTFKYEDIRCTLHQKIYSVAGLKREEREHSTFSKNFTSEVNRIVDKSIRCICGGTLNAYKVCEKCDRITKIDDYIFNLRQFIKK